MLLAEIQNGASACGDTGSDPTEKPSWLDLEKFNRGRQFFKEHFISVLLAMYCSLASGLSVTNLLVPLVHTGRSDTPEKSFKRYISTFKHVVLWHLGNVWDSRSSAFESVQLVRRMHRSVAKSINAESSPRLHVSQYDMALVQCGFMGAVLTYPEGFGIRCTQSDLEDYIHFWRGIGHLLGMDDKYNLCRGSYEETHSICKSIEENVLKKALQSPPYHFQSMADAFIIGSNTLIPFSLFTYNSIFSWIFRMWNDPSYDFDTANHLSFTDRVRLRFFQSFCWLLLKFPSVERLVNSWFINKWYAVLKIEKDSS